MDNREFLIAQPQDEEGEFMVQDAEEEKRFKEARDGDNLVTPFQCDVSFYQDYGSRATGQFGI